MQVFSVGDVEVQFGSPFRVAGQGDGSYEGRVGR